MAAEAEAFRASVAGVAAKYWGGPADAGAADAGGARMATLWAAGADQGWFALAAGAEDGQDGPLAAALAAVRALGALACPLPVIDGFVARAVLSADDKITARIASGELRALVASGPADGAADGIDGEVRYLDAGAAATHVLLLPRGSGTAVLRPMTGHREQQGIAAPAWTSVRLGPPEAQAALSAARADAAASLLRLGLAARALAAATAAHELAVAHATTRRQFGQLIGGFGAVQQRVAACQIDLTAGARLIDQAIAAHAAGRDDWPLQAELAVEFIAAAARRVQLGAHHTLGAIGYFEEHDAPWLFRRVHGDIARLGTLPLQSGSVADTLLETASTLPALDLGPVGEGFRRQVREFLAAQAGDGGQFDADPLIRVMGERGWFGLGWPARHGGRDASLADQAALFEEVTYARAPATSRLSSVMMLGNAILRHGTEAQRGAFLPLIRSGELRYCLGYSEPEAGSDLASLRTRADRDGDGWVINGQKIWTTDAHVATHVWLATRTDQDAKPRHAGITVFLIPMSSPGITVRQHRALSGEISCSVFYDDVRVPDGARVGEVNGGWKVITEALAGERIVMGGVAASLLRQLDDLLAVVRADPTAHLGPRGSAARARLSELAAALQANRALVAAALGASAGQADTPAGGPAAVAGASAAARASVTADGARLAAPMAAVFGGELAETFGEALLDLLGPAAALSGPGAPGGGAFEYELRLSIMYVVGGGTNDIQRGIIARGLGLPR
jgi:alkylation response protein AidB-like acyl-CoA dehydrogenase